MKIIKKIAVIIIMILVIVIYLANKDEKIYYVSLGDGLSRGIDVNNKEGYGYSDYINDYLKSKDKLQIYTKKFSNIDIRTTDIINNIKDNVDTIENDKKITIKNALMNADVITISTGLNEILYKLENDSIDDYVMYEYIDELTEDIRELIKLTKKYCKKDIMILGYYNPFANRASFENKKINNIIIYANNKLMNMCDEEDLYYIDLYNLFKSNKKVFTSIKSYYPNSDGYKLISEEIINILDKKLTKVEKTT